jgi:glucose 1-dehydrogenase
MGQFDQKVALVTRADSGIGREIALAFAREGASVVVNYVHRQDRAEEVRQTIEQLYHGQVLVVQADVSHYQQAKGLIEQTVGHFKRLDFMINNARMEGYSPFLDVTEEPFDRVVEADLKGVFFCAHAAAREMVKQKIAGRIINISSIHEELPIPQDGPSYCVKGGVRMLMHMICLELAPHNITVNTIGPGAFATPIVGDVNADPRKMAVPMAEIPFNRMGQPDEIGGLALYLASDAASSITGSTFFIDDRLMRHARESFKR